MSCCQYIIPRLLLAFCLVLNLELFLALPLLTAFQRELGINRGRLYLVRNWPKFHHVIRDF